MKRPAPVQPWPEGGDVQAVNDGRRHIGHVEKVGPESYVAVNAEGRNIGTFQTRSRAVGAILDAVKQDGRKDNDNH